MAQAARDSETRVRRVRRTCDGRSGAAALWACFPVFVSLMATRFRRPQTDGDDDNFAREIAILAGAWDSLAESTWSFLLLWLPLPAGVSHRRPTRTCI